MATEKIYGAICKIIEEMNPISKDKKNQQQGFAYRGIDDVMNTLKPLLAKHKVFITPEIMEQRREERQTSKGGNLIYSICTMKYTFYTDDGSHVSAVVIGEGMDSGDKATNKAMSIAFKYACFQVFCIPTDEMKDPDAETPDESKPVKKTLTERQIKRLYAIAQKANIDNDTVVDQVKKKFGCMPCELTKDQYDSVCEAYERAATQSV
ncbi:ERF family protein [Niameybacter massiliensis]|uniref:ERF family protein n=1 Tax=Niameybacter massiliensis TaxID=1658108 RepID=UPI0006B5ECE1|nr:ERF family protein [Niameybacter massiliensis]